MSPQRAGTVRVLPAGDVTMTTSGGSWCSPSEEALARKGRRSRQRERQPAANGPTGPSDGRPVVESPQRSQNGERGARARAAVAWPSTSGKGRASQRIGPQQSVRLRPSRRRRLWPWPSGLRPRRWGRRGAALPRCTGHCAASSNEWKSVQSAHRCCTARRRPRSAYLSPARRCAAVPCAVESRLLAPELNADMAAGVADEKFAASVGGWRARSRGQRLTTALARCGVLRCAAASAESLA